MPRGSSTSRQSDLTAPAAVIGNDALPRSLPPRGLSRVQAAAYIGISPTLFDEMVDDGRMPKPKRINARTIWDRQAVDEAFDTLPNPEQHNPWDGQS